VKISVRLFAVARQLAGREAIELVLPEGATIGQLRVQLAEDVPELARVLPHVLFAIGSEYAHDEDPIPDGAQVACIPPVSGG
jgi:molybdopterin converting factor small subunit